MTAGSVYDGDMPKVKEVAHEEKVRIQPTGIRPPTVLEEYERIRQKELAKKLRALRGKIHLDIDLDELRGRCR